MPGIHLTWPALAVAAALLSSLPAQAALYDEAVAGDLPFLYQDPDASAGLHILTSGENVLIGTGGWRHDGSSDTDAFLFTLPDSLAMVSVTMQTTLGAGTGLLDTVSWSLGRHDVIDLGKAQIEVVVVGSPERTLFVDLMPVPAGNHALRLYGYAGLLNAGEHRDFSYRVILATSAIPEPSLLCMVVIGMATVATGRRRVRPSSLQN